MSRARTTAPGAGTRAKLLDAALACLAEHGIAGASARTIAARAGVNQALVFYHFGSVDALLTEACGHGARQEVERYRPRLDAVGTLTELLDVGRGIRADAPHGNGLAVLAQLLAGAQADPRLAPATAQGLRLWVDALEEVLTRLLTGSPVAEMVDVPGLAAAVAASFIGLQLYEGVDAAGGARALDALYPLAVLAGALDEQRPLVRRLVGARLRRHRRGRDPR